MRTEKPNVYHYADYRSFLADYYAWNKANDPSFSHRYFSAQAGLRSYNYLKLVMDGKKRITSTFLAPFCQALKFDAREQSYFAKLVSFTDEKSAQAKTALLEELLQLRTASVLRALPVGDEARAGKTHVFEQSYYVPLIELTQTAGFRHDFKWIAQRLKISVPEARKAVKDLIVAGVLEEKGDTLVKTNRIASAPDEIPSIAIQRYHSRNLQIAAEKIFEQKVSEREYGSVTFMLDPCKLDRIKARIKAFREEIYGILDEPGSMGTEVYQLGFQFFRMTEKEDAK